MKQLVVCLKVLILLFVGANPTMAEMCNSYVGKTVSTTSFETAEEILSKIPKEKDEFETTVDFKKKVDAIVADFPENFLIGYKLIGVDPLVYDADNQQMTISEFAFTGFIDYYGRFGYGRPSSQLIAKSYKSQAIDIAVSDPLAGCTGSYEATNSLGASIVVKRCEKKAKVIFERGAKKGESSYINASPIPMSVEDAKALKTSAKVVVLITPAPPYFDKESGYRTPTLDYPYEITEEISKIIADIQCAFLLDGSSKVLGAFAVK